MDLLKSSGTLLNLGGLFKPAKVRQSSPFEEEICADNGGVRWTLWPHAESSIKMIPGSLVAFILLPDEAMNLPKLTDLALNRTQVGAIQYHKYLTI